ncbi:Os01g0578950 [Oryza sativa Japonica Group]|uniref:Os01g0578950 protein n=1 Tax=Oryza sativa subsp. japonica TaxID=39947 RepID=A0A0P0V4E0_ORYSJ|nr:Os01g0578950 [Oryza sativa Japonica Group]
METLLKLLAFGKLGNDDLPKRLSIVKKERRRAISQQHKPLRKEPSTRSATAKHGLLSLGLNLRLEPDCLPSYLWWPHHPSTQLPPNTITYTWSPHGPQTNTPLLANPCSTMGFKESPLLLLPSVGNPHWPSDHHIHPHHGAPRLDRETDWTYDGIGGEELQGERSLTRHGALTNDGVGKWDNAVKSINIVASR